MASTSQLALGQLRYLLAGTLLLAPACRDPSTPRNPDRASGPGPEAPAAPGLVPQGVTQGWEIIANPDGTIDIEFGHARIAEFRLLFWGTDWAFAAATATATADGGFEVQVPDLGVSILGSTKATAAGELSVTWRITAARARKDIIGGVVEMTVREGVAAAAGLERAIAAKEGGAGWHFGAGKGGPVEVSFAPEVASTYSERDGQIRAVLFQALESGERSQTMVIKLPGGGRVRDSPDVLFGKPDPKRWHAGTLAWDRIPFDTRTALGRQHHQPAGAHGKVEAKGDRLVFADGTPAVFWGTNVVAYSLFSGTDAAICAQANRLAAFGYNLVRLHHHDSAWVDPNVFAKGARDTQRLDPSCMGRLDRWIECLRNNGIYVWLDLHTGRRFGPGDKLEAWSEIRRQNEGEAKGYSYVNASVQRSMKSFAQAYLGHRNPNTSLRYADDPAVLGVLVTNENDLTQHHGNYMKADGGNPTHRAMMRKAAEPFIRLHGWNVEESLDAWRPGEAKIVMNELEHRAFVDAIANVRKTGFGGVVAGTSFWGDDRHWSLPSLTTGSIVDIHAYGGELTLQHNPHFSASFVHFIAAGQVEGKPLSITEWNIPAPARDRYVGPLWVAALAALQGWDAPMRYAYSDSNLVEPQQGGLWSALSDPAQMAFVPAAAIALRQGHIAPAEQTVRVSLSRLDAYGKDTSVHTSAALRTLGEQSRLVIALPDLDELDWDKPAPPTPGARTVTDLAEDFAPQEGTVIQSDTGEITRDWGRGILTVDTPKSQWAVGAVGGTTLQLADVDIALQTRYAGVAVTALDGQPLASSEQMLLTTIANAWPQGPGLKLPFLAQPVRGQISIASKHEGALELVPLLRGHADPVTPHDPVPSRRVNDRWVFELPAQIPTHWFLIRPVGSA